MANDPHRDLLPVKDTDSRIGKGSTIERIDHHHLSKLKRSEIEDRYLRLFDENTQNKKQLNNQEEKIKRLGTKLLRLLNGKKNGTEPSSRKQFEENRAIEELQMRVMELEHENYTLKDKNVVLKQQLANHSRQHVAAHRSPVRSIHASPRMSQRQSSAPNINESAYELSNRNPATEQQLQEAESNINALNEEIKSLHDKIDCLQQDLEKSCLDNQRNKVSENIELIRLQRVLKQQLIQIASLQSQIKNAENNQKSLREDLAKAHRENDDALQIVAEKQNEILDLYTKLEEKSLNRLEQEELKERINDLITERDSLKERSEFLMKTISASTKDAENVNELKRLLAQEKSKKEELNQDLENTRKMLQSIKNESANRKSYDQVLSVNNSSSAKPKLTVNITSQAATSTQTSPERSKINVTSPRAPPQKELQLLVSTQLNRPNSTASNRTQSVRESIDIMDSSFTARVLDSLAKSEQGKPTTVGILREKEESKPGDNQSRKRSKQLKHSKQVAIATPSPMLSPSVCKCGLASCSCSPVISTEEQGPPDFGEYRRKSSRSPTPVQSASEREKKHYAEKMCLEREINYLRQMLKNQALRCEAQQAEIGRLTYELKLNEEKYTDTLRRLDLHLKIFQHLELRMLQDDKNQLTDEQRNTILSFASEMNPSPPTVIQNRLEKTEHAKPKEMTPQPSTSGQDKIPSLSSSPEKEKISTQISPAKEIFSTPSASAKEIISGTSTPAKEIPSGSSTPSNPSSKGTKVEASSKSGSPVKKDGDDKKSAKEGRKFAKKHVDVHSPKRQSSKPSLIIRGSFDQKDWFQRQTVEPEKKFIDNNFLSSSEQEEEDEDLIVEKELTTNLYDTSSKSSSQKNWRKSQPGNVVKTDGSKTPTTSVNSKLVESTSKYSSQSLASPFPSDSNFNFSRMKNIKGEPKEAKAVRPVPKPRPSVDPKAIREEAEKGQSFLAKHDRHVDKKSTVRIGVEWLKLEKNSSIWKNEDVRLLFIDFSFLDVQGEETETPNSLPKPKKPEDKCEYNFYKEIEMNENRRKLFKNIMQKPENEIIVFKIVSDPEDFPDDIDCIDLGMAVVTVEEFFKNGYGQLTLLKVKNVNNPNEIIGTLAVTLTATPDIFLLKSPVI